MSSFVAHALVGASCFALARPKTFQQALPLMLIAALLGMSPDVDYLFLWLLDWRPVPRITHSLAFVSFAALSAWVFVKAAFKDKANPKLLLIFFTAAASHLLLDALVGGTKDPIAWPFSNDGFGSPIGLLPSAGKLSLSNYYFWRNLLIELGIFLPIILFGSYLFGVKKRNWQLWKKLLCLGLFLVSVFISLSLSRH